MTSDHAEAGITGIFFRLMESSRRLLGHSKTATEAEISHLSLVIDQEIIPRLQMTFPSPTPDVDEVATTARNAPAAIAASTLRRCSRASEP